MYKCNKCGRVFKKTSAYINHSNNCKLTKKAIKYIRYDYVKNFMSIREIRDKYKISLTLCDLVLKDFYRDKDTANKLTKIKERSKGIKRKHTDMTKLKISLKMKKFHNENTTKGESRQLREANKKEKELYGGTKAYIESTIKRRKVERPSYKELLSKKETHSLKSLGKIYGVSHVTIRNWIIWYEKHEGYIKED